MPPLDGHKQRRGNAGQVLINIAQTVVGNRTLVHISLLRLTQMCPPEQVSRSRKGRLLSRSLLTLPGKKAVHPEKGADSGAARNLAELKGPQQPAHRWIAVVSLV